MEARERALYYAHQTAYPGPINVPKKETMCGLHASINATLSRISHDSYFHPSQLHAARTGLSSLTTSHLLFQTISSKGGGKGRSQTAMALTRDVEDTIRYVPHRGPFDGPDPIIDPKGRRIESPIIHLAMSPDSHAATKQPKTQHQERENYNQSKDGTDSTTAEIAKVLTKTERLHMRELESVMKNAERARSNSPRPLSLFDIPPVHQKRLEPPTLQQQQQQQESQKKKKIIRPIPTPELSSIATSTPTLPPPPPLEIAIKQREPPPPPPPIAETLQPGGSGSAHNVLQDHEPSLPYQDPPSSLMMMNQTTGSNGGGGGDRATRFSSRHRFNQQPAIDRANNTQQKWKLRAQGSSGALRKKFYLKLENDPKGDVNAVKHSLRATEATEPVYAPDGVRSLWKGDKNSSVRQCMDQRKKEAKQKTS